jgi:hypothetical protein
MSEYGRERIVGDMLRAKAAMEHADDCTCPYVYVGGTNTGSRNWSPNCTIHRKPANP